MDLIPAQYYYDVYLVMVTLLSFSCLTFYNGRDVSLSLNVNQENKKAFRLFFIFAIFVGVRPISEYFADMTQYYGIYTRWSGSFTFNWDVENLLYDNQMMWFANIRLEPVIYYLYIAFIYFGGMYVARCFPEMLMLLFWFALLLSPLLVQAQMVSRLVLQLLFS